MVGSGGRGIFGVLFHFDFSLWFFTFFLKMMMSYMKIDVAKWPLYIWSDCRPSYRDMIPIQYRPNMNRRLVLGKRWVVGG